MCVKKGVMGQSAERVQQNRGRKKLMMVEQKRDPNLPGSKIRHLTHAEWTAEAERRFGADSLKWKFVCPSCGYVASVKDWLDTGCGEGPVAFSCIGGYTGSPKKIFDRTGGPCNYAGGGLFKLNPVAVMHDGKETRVFEFADA